MNKKYLPLMSSFVFCRVFIVLVDFRLHCVTTVTRLMKGVTVALINTRQNTKEDIKSKYFLFIVLNKSSNFMKGITVAFIRLYKTSSYEGSYSGYAMKPKIH